jgi:hypothetical protein
VINVNSLILDATELRKDWLCTGLKFQLLEHMIRQTLISVYIPASVLEEVVAHHGRAVEEANKKLETAVRDRRLLGLGPVKVEDTEFDYRAYLVERFDEVLSITVTDWPNISHRELVTRAVSRKPPFDQKGSGYRDSLVWADVIALAKAGHDVVLVSEDRIFADPNGMLAAQLRAEVASIPGRVELVRDLGKWLLAQLPWTTASLKDAVAYGRDQQFYEFYLQSDLQSDLIPEAQDLGLRRAPYSLEITDIRWGGLFAPLGAVRSPDGLILAEYDLDQDVDFEAELPEATEVEDGWEVSSPNYLGHIGVRGQVRMIVRLAVLFDDEFGLSVEELSWRRSDGSGPGAVAAGSIPGQLSLFESEETGMDVTSS